jgi:hypothetical protein
VVNAIKSFWRWLTDDNWQRRHFVLSPFGIAATTLLVTYFRDEANRPPIARFDDMAGLVSVSAVLYGMVAVLAESLGGKVMFYTLSQIGKAMRAVKEYHRAAVIEQIRTDPEFRAEVLAGVEPDERRRHRRRRRLAKPVNGAAR